MPKTKRWRAAITYIDGSGIVFYFDEFVDLGAAIEGGPNWNLIGGISLSLTERSPIGDFK